MRLFDLEVEPFFFFFIEHHFPLDRQLWQTNNGYSDLTTRHVFFSPKINKMRLPLRRKHMEVFIANDEI